MYQGWSNWSPRLSPSWQKTRGRHALPTTKWTALHVTEWDALSSNARRTTTTGYMHGTLLATTTHKHESNHNIDVLRRILSTIGVVSTPQEASAALRSVAELVVKRQEVLLKKWEDDGAPIWLRSRRRRPVLGALHTYMDVALDARQLWAFVAGARSRALVIETKIAEVSAAETRWWTRGAALFVVVGQIKALIAAMDSRATW